MKASKDKATKRIRGGRRTKVKIRGEKRGEHVSNNNRQDKRREYRNGNQDRAQTTSVRAKTARNKEPLFVKHIISSAEPLPGGEIKMLDDLHRLR